MLSYDVESIYQEIKHQICVMIEANFCHPWFGRNTGDVEEMWREYKSLTVEQAGGVTPNLNQYIN